MNNSEIPIKTFLAIIVSIFGLFIVFVGFVLNIKTNLAIWQITGLLAILSVLFSTLLYIFYKSSMNKSREVLREENEMLNDVATVKYGQFDNKKTSLGKWYTGAIIVSFLFPFIEKIISKYTKSEQTESIILLIIGYIMIITFLIGIILSNKKGK